MTILITGGSGFVGGAIVRRLLASGKRVVDLDARRGIGTAEIPHEAIASGRYRRIKGDICDETLLLNTFEDAAPEAVIHCAQDPRVEAPFDGPAAFLHTNVSGTFQVLEAARTWIEGRKDPFRFVHVTAHGPGRGPGSSGHRVDRRRRSGDAASNHLVRTWAEAFGLPVLSTWCSDLYGPWQAPDRLIPLMTINAIERRALPVYDAGREVRRWVHVDDHATAIERVLAGGTPGASYAVGGDTPWRFMDVVHSICADVDRRLPQGMPRSRWIRQLPDLKAPSRPPGAAECSKIRRDVAWRPEIPLKQGLSDTIGWYIGNRHWWQVVRATRHGDMVLGALPEASPPRAVDPATPEAVS